MAGRCGRTVSSMILAVAALAVTGALAQSPARAVYDFEQNTHGFTPILLKDALMPDPGATAVVTREKERVRSGSGSLAYSYEVRAGEPRTLVAEAGIPKDAASVRLWVKSSASTVLVLSLRSAGGGDHALSFYIPAGDWREVGANLDELQPGENAKGRVDAAAVTAVGLTDLAVLLVNAPEFARLVPDLKGSRTVWLDDLQFSAGRLPQTYGPVQHEGRPSLLLDSFETGTIRWIPVRVQLGGAMPRYEIFPAAMALQVRADAAPPGALTSPVDPGGSGLRVSYQRAPQEAFGMLRTVDKEDLARAERVRLSLNMSRPSLVLITLKEKDDSEYQQLLMPERTVGWQKLDLPLGSFTLSDNSRDENNVLDAAQIKELSILDASAFAQLEGGLTTMELDAASFVMRVP